MSAIVTIRRSTVTLRALPTLVYGLPVVPPAEAYRDMVTQVRPARGYQSNIALGDSIVKLVDAGVIDRKKLEAIYADGDGARRS